MHFDSVSVILAVFPAFMCSESVALKEPFDASKTDRFQVLRKRTPCIRVSLGACV